MKLIRICIEFVLKKSELIQKTLDLKGKVAIDADMHKLCEKIKRLTESVNQIEIVAENKKLQSDIERVKNINHKVEGKIVYLEKNQTKGVQYSRRKKVETSAIPNTIPDNLLQNIVISICRDSGVEIDPKDIRGCHRVPLSRNSRRGQAAE